MVALSDKEIQFGEMIRELVVEALQSAHNRCVDMCGMLDLLPEAAEESDKSICLGETFAKIRYALRLLGADLEDQDADSED